jgi:hypothetical protein
MQYQRSMGGADREEREGLEALLKRPADQYLDQGSAQRVGGARKSHTGRSRQTTSASVRRRTRESPLMGRPR